MPISKQCASIYKSELVKHVVYTAGNAGTQELTAKQRGDKCASLRDYAESLVQSRKATLLAFVQAETRRTADMQKIHEESEATRQHVTDELRPVHASLKKNRVCFVRGNCRCG